MESIKKETGRIMGNEILFFEEAELEKVKNGTPSFATFGPLSVLYLKDYNRFVLQVNDWKYPLLRRLSISASDKNDLSSRTYILPALNGFTYHLKLNKIPSHELLSNFETILGNNSHFSFKGEEGLAKKLEQSPDDKLVRHTPKDTGLKETISENVKHIIEKVKIHTETMKTGTKHLTSTKKRVDQKSIKNKDFFKDAHSTFKKDFFKASEKLSQEFLHMRKDNLNLKEAKGFDELKKSSHGPHLFVSKEEIEDAILNNKDIISI